MSTPTGPTMPSGTALPAGTARLAADIGGTFTDVVLEDGAGRLHTAKVLTTAAAPELGVLDGIATVLAAAGVAPGEVTLFVHGTTLATNALIERKGARTGLLTTAGFRDTLEIAHEDRFEQYDLQMERPEPLVPRELRLGVRERHSAQGEVLVALDEDGVRAAAEQFRRAGVEAVAIGFLHAYVAPAHEQRAAALLGECLPGVWLTLASEVCPEIREYERFSTACANAYVQPLMAGYLRRLEAGLAGLGVQAPFFLLQSSGGLCTLEQAVRQPVMLVESGPAGGAILAARLARQHGIARLLSFDMGGTTAKLCLVEDGVPATARDFEVARRYRFLRGSGLPLRIPVIDMVEIGAGGGSVARVDGLGRVAVGPDSAGSEPGPACYGRGGTGAAVTDADLMLGRLDPVHFAGGRVALHPEASYRALATHLAIPLGMLTADPGSGESASNRRPGPGDIPIGMVPSGTLQKGTVPRSTLREGMVSAGMVEGQSAEGVALAAYAVTEVVEENMAAAARVHAVEKGRDVRRCTMVAFGGAAPLHACRLADKLGIDRIIVPAGAGVGSAIGFLRAPVTYEAVRTRYQRLDAFDERAVAGVLRSLNEEAAAVIAGAAPGAATVAHYRAAMRYVGQGHEVEVTLPADRVNAADLQRRFEAAYHATFARIIPNLAVEVLSWMLTLSTETAPPPPLRIGTLVPSVGATEGEDLPTRMAFDAGRACWLSHRVVERTRLDMTTALSGPALVIEDQTTTVIGAGFVCGVDSESNLIIDRAIDPTIDPMLNPS
ncbi:MAG: hydantoinase/oxoprolinase family protein [Acidimicrobiales bacterium]